MKKIILLCVFVTSSSLLAAQDFKPVKGDWGAEVNFTPFSSSPISINYIRLRNFTEDNSAFRLGLFLGVNVQNPAEDLTNTTVEINIRPGLEKHFEGTKRLSPYSGMELDLAYKFSKSAFDDGTNTATFEGAWNDNGFERGFIRFGVNTFAGFDLYIFKNLYLGTEFGFGFEYIKQLDIVEKSNDNEIGETKGGSTFRLGPNVNGAIRLGFNF